MSVFDRKCFYWDFYRIEDRLYKHGQYLLTLSNFLCLRFYLSENLLNLPKNNINCDFDRVF